MGSVEFAGEGLEDFLTLHPHIHHASLSKKASSSSTPPRSRSLTPTPPAEYIKRQLATFYPREKDRRALAASSSAIALSFVSASCDPNDATPDEPSSSKESSWKTVYGAARIVVEAAKESSDMCPPLKAVVGVLSVLIKNYEVCHSQASRLVDRTSCLTANHRERESDRRHRGKDTITWRCARISGGRAGCRREGTERSS